MMKMLWSYVTYIFKQTKQFNVRFLESIFILTFINITYSQEMYSW